MKRKLDENDRPAGSSEAPAATTPEAPKAEASFADMNLDARLVQAVAKLSYPKPTLVQQKAIPLALTGQDVLCKGKTGSGKTAAYVLPVLSTILKNKQVRSDLPLEIREIMWLIPGTDANLTVHLRADPGTNPRTRRPGLQGYRAVLDLLRQGYHDCQIDGQTLRSGTEEHAIQLP